jgi:hypothetical protein
VRRRHIGALWVLHGDNNKDPHQRRAVHGNKKPTPCDDEIVLKLQFF